MTKLKKILATGLFASSLLGFGASVVSFASEDMVQETGSVIYFCHRNFFENFPDYVDPDEQPEVEEQEQEESSSSMGFGSAEQMLRYRGAEQEQAEEFNSSDEDLNSQGYGTNYSVGSCCNCFFCTIQ